MSTDHRANLKIKIIFTLKAPWGAFSICGVVEKLLNL